MNAPTPAYRRGTNVVFRKILDEHLLVPVRGKLADMQRVFALNPVAAFIWNALDGRHTPAEIAADVVRHFAVEPAAAQADVDRFLEELRASGLVETAGEPTQEPKLKPI